MERLIYSATEAAELLGTRPNTIQRLLESGEIPAYRDGKNWKIPKTLLLKYIEDKAIAEAKERRTN